MILYILTLTVWFSFNAVLQKLCHGQKYWHNDVLISTVNSFHPNNSPPVRLRDPGNI